jgi:hypothetical protein
LALMVVLCLAAIVLPTLDADRLLPWLHGVAFAQSAGDSEKEAFDEAKTLGTVEAWDAFLSNYPTGFHADLARACQEAYRGIAGFCVIAVFPDGACRCRER